MNIVKLGATVASLSALLVACQPKPSTTLQSAPEAAPKASVKTVSALTQVAKPEFGTFGVDLSSRDTSVKPGDDFFAYANGAWLASYELKPDEQRYGPMIELTYRAERDVKAIIDGLIASSPEPGSIEQKIADYYTSFMDVAAIDKKGITPLRPELERIAAIKTRAQLIDVLAAAAMVQTDAPLMAGVSVDSMNPNQYQIYIVHAGLGLPDRAYYLDANEGLKQVRAAYRANIAQMLAFVPGYEKRAPKAAEKVLALEVAIARHHWPRAELRDRTKTYNLMSLEKLRKISGGYDWKRHLEAAGFDVAAIKSVVVMTPNAIAPLAKLVARTPIRVWKDYLTYHLIANRAPLLGSAIEKAHFAFYGRILGGQPEQRDRWKRGVQLVAGGRQGLAEAVGSFYVRQYFPPRSKAMVKALVENLRAVLAQRIKGLAWMSPETKRAALAKLAAFVTKIGYPDKWRDFSSIEIVKDDLIANQAAVEKYWYQDNLQRLGKPTDRQEWGMPPQMVNAYYRPDFNEIVFPAAILQPPFFDPNADPAVNYGSIGAVIGHEMGHGFDDQGSKSDAEGIQRNWWTAADRERFEARAQKLVEQYSQYEPIKGYKINGQLTLGENIGDLGGLSIAYNAYKLSLHGKPAPVIEGLTGDQRFFLAWAQAWRQKSRDAVVLRAIKSDPHSPNRFRVDGVVRNMDAWYAAFDVQPGQALYLAPDERVSIW